MFKTPPTDTNTTPDASKLEEKTKGKKQEIDKSPKGADKNRAIAEVQKDEEKIEEHKKGGLKP